MHPSTPPPPSWGGPPEIAVAPPAAASWREGARGDLAAAAALIVGAVIAGIPLGWWWQSMSPSTRAFVDSNGYVIPEESESQISADMRALFLFLGLGAAIGVGAWLWRARRGPILLVGAALAALAGAGSIALVGHWLSGGDAHGAPRSVITLPVTLHAGVFLLLAPLLCALIYACCAIFAADDDLGRRGRGAGAPDESGPQVFVLGADQRRRDDGGSDPTYASATSIS